MYSAPAGWFMDLKVHSVWMKNNFIYFFFPLLCQGHLFSGSVKGCSTDNILPVICFRTFKDVGIQSFFLPANTYVYSQMARWQWCNTGPIFKSCHWSFPPLQERLKNHFYFCCRVNYFWFSHGPAAGWGLLNVKTDIVQNTLLLVALRSMPTDAKNNLFHFLCFSTASHISYFFSIKQRIHSFTLILHA